MRKIETQDIKDKKKKRTQTILGILLIFLMVSSTIGFVMVFSGSGFDNVNSGNSITYNNIEFTRNANGLWQFQYLNSVFVTNYNPEEVKNVSFDFNNSITNFYNKPLYYVIDDKSAVNIVEIIQNIAPFASRYQEACLAGETCRNDNLVEKTCSDNVIIMLDSEEIKTYKDENCIFIEAPLNQQIFISDALIFHLLNI